MDKESTAIEIPTDLYKKIEEEIKKTGVSSVSAYITSLLQEKLSAVPAVEESLSSDDEEKVKERLKALGYMD